MYFYLSESKFQNGDCKNKDLLKSPLLKSLVFPYI